MNDRYAKSIHIAPSLGAVAAGWTGFAGAWPAECRAQAGLQGVELEGAYLNCPNRKLANRSGASLRRQRLIGARLNAATWVHGKVCLASSHLLIQ